MAAILSIGLAGSLRAYQDVGVVRDVAQQAIDMMHSRRYIEANGYTHYPSSPGARAPLRSTSLATLHVPDGLESVAEAALRESFHRTNPLAFSAERAAIEYVAGDHPDTAELVYSARSDGVNSLRQRLKRSLPSSIEVTAIDRPIIIRAPVGVLPRIAIADALSALSADISSVEWLANALSVQENTGQEMRTRTYRLGTGLPPDEARFTQLYGRPQ